MNVPVMIADALAEAFLRLFPSCNRGHAVAAWPRAWGRVTQSDVHSSMLPGLYRARITVEYWAEGERRAYRRVRRLYMLERALAQTLRHPVGEQVSLSYNPENPTEAVLAARTLRRDPAPAIGAAAG